MSTATATRPLVFPKARANEKPAAWRFYVRDSVRGYSCVGWFSLPDRHGRGERRMRKVLERYWRMTKPNAVLRDVSVGLAGGSLKIENEMHLGSF